SERLTRGPNTTADGGTPLLARLSPFCLSSDAADGIAARISWAAGPSLPPRGACAQASRRMLPMKKASRWCALVAVLFGLFAALPLAAQGPGGYPARPGEIIIKFKTNTSAHDHGAILSDLGATQLSHLPPGRGEHLRITKFSVDRAIARYRHHPKIEFIEPNYVYRIVTTPNDPEFFRLWGLSNTGQDGGLPGADIDATRAWDVFTGSDGLVAITDTGIDYTHPDLAANVFANPGEIAGNGIDDDNNGFID